ncbi:hypothetical protein [Dactylosporangium sp. NPDC051484]|uniref:hypothetical protein n=1 Tax=Dactylosporangium sp. NPDC051484 TaxID=3154942 RepID=UPI00344BE511
MKSRTVATPGYRQQQPTRRSDVRERGGSVAWEWVSPVVTGVLGVAGIGGTVWAASLARRAHIDVARAQAEAEARRLLRAEKREVYGRALQRLNELAANCIAVASLTDKVEVKPGPQSIEDDLGEASRRHSALLSEVHQMQGELAVIASTSITSAFAAAVYATNKLEMGGSHDLYLVALEELTSTMRGDLYVLNTIP